MNALDVAIVSKLRADATLMGLLARGTASVFGYQAPENEPHPFVLFNEQAEADSYTFGGRAYEDFRYQIKGITEGDSMLAAGAIADRLFVVLNDATLTISGGTAMVCRKESNVKYPETSGGARFNHAGGIYRIAVR